MKEFDPSLKDSVFMLPEKDSGSIVSSNPDTKKQEGIPTVVRDKRGRATWKHSENSPEQNEELGIRNIQALFLEKFPIFYEMFEEGKVGTIKKGKEEDARRFILEHLRSKNKFGTVFGNLAYSRDWTPYFEGSFNTALKKSFEPWGIKFKIRDFNKVRDLWKNKTKEEILEIVRKIFVEEYPEFCELYLIEDTSKADPEKVKEAKRFVLEKLSFSGNFRKLFGAVTRYNLSFNNSHFNVIHDAFVPWGIRFEIREIKQFNLKVFNLRTAVPEGWMAYTKLAQNLEVSPQSTKNTAEKYRINHPEWFHEFVSARGTHEYYSPELAEAVARDLLPQKVVFGWRTTGGLAKELGKAIKTIRKIALKYSKAHPEWLRSFLTAGRGKHEYYSPELVDIIKQEVLLSETSPQGWRTIRSLALDLGIGEYVLRNISNKLRLSNPELFRWYLINGRLFEHLSPKLIEEIERVIGRNRNHREEFRSEPISPQEAKEEFDKLFEE
ncbi:MAG: hypothetical protein A2857_03235 [Candidatus Levybacteria bacterium RIFCSPHIGHO2_01_FULL_36_15]|nr:MAG: hypothetical protein A2857_03235 [Candidatus Levybacteria bacterium RIFCSPHIGHO2_01_FULL_36_15]